MEKLSRDWFKVYNGSNDLTKVFEKLCLDYFLRTEKISQKEIVFIDHNNVGIETHPVNSGTIGLQAKFVDSIVGFNKAINESLTRSKLSIYKKLNKVLVITNIDFSISARKKNPLINKIGKIDIIYINGKTFLQELSKPEFYDLVYTYFSGSNLGGFFKKQQVKYKEYHSIGFESKLINIIKDDAKRKISIESFLLLITSQNKISLITGIPASGKSLLVTHYLHILGQLYIQNKQLFPICINLVQWESESLLTFINNKLSEFQLNNISYYSDIIIFIDGLNEVSKEKCEILIQDIEDIIRCHINIKKIVIFSRKGSINNSFIKMDHNQYTIYNKFIFDIENYVNNSFKNIKKIGILEPKFNIISNFIGKLSLSINFYEENKLLSLQEFQNNIKESLSINSNHHINEIVEFLCDTNMLTIVNIDSIIFNDQKLYEYFFIKYILNNFLDLLSKLRNYNFFYKYELIENIIKDIDQSFKYKSFSEKVVKNLFIDRFYKSSFDESGWGFDTGILFTKALLNINGFDIYINENKTIGFLFKSLINPYTIHQLNNLGKYSLASKLRETYFEKLNYDRKNRIKWYRKNKDIDQNQINIKFREYNMDKYYDGYSYVLINSFIKNQKDFRLTKISKEESNQDLLIEIVYFYIFLGNSGYYEEFNNYLDEVNNINLLRLIVVEFTKSENIYLVNLISDNVLGKVRELFKFDVIIENIKNIKFFSDKNDYDISLILFIMYHNIYNKEYELNLEYKNILKEYLYSEQIFWSIGQNPSEKMIEVETKLIMLCSIINGLEWQIIPLSNEYGGNKYSRRISKNRTLIGLSEWFISYLNGSTKESFLDVYLVFESLWEKADYGFYSINSLYLKIIFSIIKYLIESNQFPKELLKIIIERCTDNHIKVELIKKIITDTNYKDYDKSLTNFLLRQIQSTNTISYTEHYECLLMICYITGIKNNNSISSIYLFEEALNHTYIRYGWRKDPFLHYVIDVIEEGYNNGYIDNNKLYSYCKRLIDIYIKIIDHADGKGVREIPALIFNIVGKFIPDHLPSLRKDFGDSKSGRFFLVGEFNALWQRIANFEDIDNLLEDIDSINKYNIEYKKEKILIKVILFVRILNISYYQYSLNQLYWEDTYEKIKIFLGSIKSYFESYETLRAELTSLSRFMFDIEQTIKDIKKLIEIGLFETLNGSLIDLEKINSDYNYKYENILELDFSKDITYQLILEDYHKYDLSKLTDDNISFLINQFSNKYPNDYMERILKSRLFGSICLTMYNSYGEKLSKRFGVALYKSNNVKFKELINSKLIIDDVFSGYFTNMKLASLIIIEEDDGDDYIKFIENLLNLSDLMCL